MHAYISQPYTFLDTLSKSPLSAVARIVFSRGKSEVSHHRQEHCVPLYPPR